MIWQVMQNLSYPTLWFMTIMDLDFEFFSVMLIVRSCFYAKYPGSLKITVKNREMVMKLEAVDIAESHQKSVS